MNPQIDKILDYFQVELVEYSDKFQGSCLVHQDSDSDAFILYKNTNLWFCFTHYCHEIFGKSIVGLVRGLLSRRNGWCGRHDSSKMVSVPEALKFLNSFGISTSIPTLNKIQRYKSKFIKKSKQKIADIEHVLIDKSCLENLSVPSAYYSLTEGYNPSILSRYGVGDYDGPNTTLKGRAVVPVYQNNELMGYSARVRCKLPCLACKHYHKPENSKCFQRHEKEKWLHSYGFKKNLFLYNLDNAREHIIKNKCVIIVESPGDLWRLVESGVNNCVASFGCGLSEYQKNLIMNVGLLNLNKIVIAYNNDDAGDEAIERLKYKFPRYFNVNSISPVGHNDFGEMSINKIKELFK